MISGKNVVKIIGTRYHHYEYTKEDLVQLLGLGKHKPNITIYVDIPGGGDWSNQPLTIGEDTPVLRVVIEEEIK